ncbi:MAG TPA: preprotein translocase subunit SecE [Elusimicrobiota bacterium]|nr:preprotein translocase subunit SecE [Elusimicrobiota bacterium]
MSELIKFFKEAYDELKRVTWLSKTEMLASTWLVILLVIVMAIYVGAVDYIIMHLFRLLI